MASPEIIKTPKHYWEIRRKEGHRDWTFGFWRELFQNSVDAGAKNISVTVSSASGKGSFGRDPAMDQVIRVTFEDDGKGMDEKIIREVFLSPGQSTKKTGETVGGFGTARIMLCFSQVRYGVRTQNMVVEGDGSEYVVLDVPSALAAKRAEIDAALNQGKEAQVASLRAEMAELQSSPNYMKGCRLEIDIDPSEPIPGSWSSHTITAAHMLESLNNYLEMSQVGCKIKVNGAENTLKTNKGPARRVLVAEKDGIEVEFGKVHTSQSERAKYKNKVIFRVDGATMFTSYTSANYQVIVEIDKAKARQVLTDNRDSLKSPYSEALDAFLEELAVDTESAMKKKDKRQHIEIAGGKGKLVAVPPGIAQTLSEISFSGGRNATGNRVAARYTTDDEYRRLGFGGVPHQVVDKFIEAVAKGEDTFLAKASGEAGLDTEELNRFREMVANRQSSDVLNSISPELSSYIATQLAACVDEANQKVDKASSEAASRFADMNDIHIQVEDLGDDEITEKLKTAVRRYNPNYWRKKGESLEGRGLEAHMLLATWQASVEEALRAALSLRPGLAKDGTLNWAVGWCFARSEPRYEGDGWRKSTTRAQHQDREGAHLFLLNPVFENGQPAFDLRRERRDLSVPSGENAVMGRQDIEAFAMHEVTHLLTSRHDESFAGFFTEIASVFDRVRSREKAREYIDATREAYGRGKSRIQAMESVVDILPEEDAPTSKSKRQLRPAEKLLAHSAPVAAVVMGAVVDKSNISVEAIDVVRREFCDSIAPAEDGTVVVDCDRLQNLDTTLSNIVTASLDAPLDLSFEATIDPPPLVSASPAIEAPLNLDFVATQEPPSLLPITSDRSSTTRTTAASSPQPVERANSTSRVEQPQSRQSAAYDPLSVLNGLNLGGGPVVSPMSDIDPLAALSSLSLPQEQSSASSLIGDEFDDSAFDDRMTP